MEKVQPLIRFEKALGVQSDLTSNFVLYCLSDLVCYSFFVVKLK